VGSISRNRPGAVRTAPGSGFSTGFAKKNLLEATFFLTPQNHYQKIRGSPDFPITGPHFPPVWPLTAHPPVTIAIILEIYNQRQGLGAQGSGFTAENRN
jgi:hypothetical protein